jgi:hypothetical protein
MPPRMRWTIGLLLLPVLLLAAALVAQATTTVSYFRVKGDTGVALFSGVEPSNECVLNFAAVVAADIIEKDRQSGKTLNLKTTVAISQVDTCVGELLFLGEGVTDISTFQVASNLSTATLTATVPVTDVLSRSTANFEVNVTWQATSKPTTTNVVESFTDKALGLKVKSSFHGRVAEAVATGSVVGLDRNFTLLPSDQATIGQATDGTHIVEKSF